MLRQFFKASVPLKDETSPTPSKQSEAKLQLSKLDYDNIFESMEEGFASCQMIYDKIGKPVDFRYLYVNPAFAKQTGLSVQQVMGRTVKEVIPNIEPFWIETYGRVVASGKSEHFENRVASIGRLFEIKVWRLSEGCFSVIFEDITDRKKVEEALKSRTKELESLIKSQEEAKRAILNVMEDLEETKKTLNIERLKDEAMLSSIGDGVVGIDKIGKVIIINQAGCKLLGFKTSELLGKKLVEVTSMIDEKGDLIPRDKRPAQMVIAGDASTTTTPAYYFIRKDKTKFPVAITARPIISGGEIIGAIEVFRDITHEMEIDKAKSEFVSLASHQLRTPVGIMKWHLEALQDEPYFKKAPQVIQNYVDVINKSNERELSLVRDLLSVSRIEQGQIKNVPRPVNLIALVTESVEQMQIVARKKQVALRLSIQGRQIPFINIDILRLQEVVENLIANAIENTMAAGSVDVSLSKVGDKVSINVKDTGVGISEADQAKIFSKFFRSGNAIKHNPQGAGLGLYVVKSYTEEWGGKVSVQSKEGKGSTFTINLPLKPKSI